MVVSWIRRGSNHLFVERVDLAARRFVHLGRVEVVGEVTSNQILRHCLLLKWSSGRLVALPSLYNRTAGPEFDKSSKKIPTAAAIPKQTGFGLMPKSFHAVIGP